jgi:hypothetical protein
MAPGSATGDTVVAQGMAELSTVVASVPAMFQAPSFLFFGPFFERFSQIGP